MIYINKKEIKIFGSQGQNRTAMLSLKLAELQVIYDEIGEYPILLLDDFMSELDRTCLLYTSCCFIDNGNRIIFIKTVNTIIAKP